MVGVDFVDENHTLETYDQKLIQPVLASDGSVLRTVGTIIPGENHGAQKTFLNSQIADYPAASDFINTLLSCKAFIPNSSSNYNYPQFCNKKVDRQIASALRLALTSQEAANALWARIDRQITDQAPWLPLVNPAQLDFLSKRLHNYIHSAQDKILLDQLQVQ